MPEGPQVHRHARQQARRFQGKKLRAASPQGRFAEEARKLDNKTLHAIEAHGKHLFYEFGRHLILHVHLGLAGRFRIWKNPPPGPRESCRVRFLGETHTLDLTGPNQCHLVSLAEKGAILARLGPDPLRGDADPMRFVAAAQKSKRRIGAILMDQKIIAGVGNIYRAEVLFAERVDPATRGCDIDEETLLRLWQRLAEWMPAAVRRNKILTVDLADAGLAKKGRRYFVYKQDHCPYTGGPIASWKENGRMVYASPEWQNGPALPRSA